MGPGVLVWCPKRSGPHSAAKQGPSSARVCPKGSGPHSAAKQGRSFRVAALNHPVSLCAQGGPSHILQQKQSRSCRVAALNSASPSINLEKYG